MLWIVAWWTTRVPASYPHVKIPSQKLIDDDQSRDLSGSRQRSIIKQRCESVSITNQRRLTDEVGGKAALITIIAWTFHLDSEVNGCIERVKTIHARCSLRYFGDDQVTSACYHAQTSLMFHHYFACFSLKLFDSLKKKWSVILSFSHSCELCILSIKTPTSSPIITLQGFTQTLFSFLHSPIFLLCAHG